MANMSFKEYLEGRSKFERQKSREKLLEDFEKFKKRQKVMEQKTQASSGKMIKKMVVGSAVSVGRRNKDKIKKKIKDIGDMKVKDAAKAVGRGLGALTPIGLGKIVGKKITGANQRPVIPTPKLRERDPDRIRERMRPGRMKPIPMPKVMDMRINPMGGMGPGVKSKRPSAMLTGGQIKIAKKAPPFNKIDEKDFAVLRAEKAKGRGKGLQDEKMKPGRTMKAALGAIALGLGAKKKMKNKKMVPVAMGGIGAAMAKQAAIKKILGRNKGGMGEAKNYKKYLRGLERVTSKTRYDKAVAKRKALEASKKIGSRAMDAAKATKIGKIAAGVAAAALAAKAGLEKMYEKRTGRKPFTKRPNKKMGGGMMMKKPMMMSGGLTEATQKLKAQGKMGGGMMQRPMMAMGGGMMPGYKKGKSVMAKGCKLGRKRPTKMYT